MDTGPRGAGRRVARGLATAVTVAATVLAATATASAATRPAVPHTRHSGKTRDIRLIKPAKSGGSNEKARKKTRPATRPQEIAIPAIGVDASLMTLGGDTAPTGPGILSLPVPPLAQADADAGWYQFTARPGAAGNAVVVGHVDTYAGPGVFYNLYLLRPGDSVYVRTGDTSQHFEVTSVREMPKTDFPVNQVFGGTRKHELRLITCAGEFDYATRHYLDNIVVSAVWVPAPRPAPRQPRTAQPRRLVYIREKAV